MKLLVLGSSGGCGRWVVRIARERGHEVTAVVRPGCSFEPEATRVERGDVTEGAFLLPLLDAHRTVLSCLGIRRASVFPWSRLLSPPDLMQQVSTIVKSARTMRRFIWISAGGVGDSYRQASFLVKRMTRTGSVGAQYRDLEAAERILADAPFSTLAVRAVTLMSGPPVAAVGAVDRYGLFSTIRRAEVARWMVDVADGTLDPASRTVLLGRLQGRPLRSPEMR